MCGIAGIKKYGNKPIEEIMVRMFLTGLEKRGNDATGIAMQDKKGEIFTLKNDVQAWAFVTSNEYKDWINEHLTDDIEQVILHTRAATKGSPRQSVNNHPLFNGKAAIVHNGKIENDNELFKKLKLERVAETDTDILRALVDKHGVNDELINAFREVRGSAALAAFSPEYPGRMILGRSGSPLCVGSTEDFFCFASEKSVIHRAMRPWVERFGIHFQKQSLEMAFSPFPDHTLWILGPDGKERHGEFKSFWGTYRDPIRRVYTGYKERQDEWTNKAKIKDTIKHYTIKDNKEEAIYLSCPKCNKPLVINKEQLKMDLNQLICPLKHGGCGSPLEGARVN